MLAAHRIMARAWSPASLPGLLHWYAADKIVGLTDGAAVSSWPDLSGNGYAAVQANGSKQPTWHESAIGGLPAVSFTSVQNVACTTVPVPGVFSLAIVVNWGTSGNWADAWAAPASQSGAVLGLDANAGRAVFLSNQSANLDGIVPAANTPYAHMGICNGASSSIWTNGTQNRTGSAGGNPQTGILMGSNVNAFLGTIGEAVLCSGALSALSIAQLFDYLLNKWQI